MKFEKIYKNITGISCPIFGIQWNPPIIEVHEAEKVVIFLEDKRVLFNSIEMENVEYCARSVIEIRKELTRALQALPSDSNLSKQLKRMRRACQEFNDALCHPNFSHLDYPIQKSIFERAIFKLRGKFGLAVAEVVNAYGLDVDDGLASIIPFNNTGNK